MRASTLFAIAIAVFLGLAVVAAAKYSGIFATKAPPPPPVVVKPKILVAAKNLFENMTILPGDVRVREIKPEEEEHYSANKAKYLPATVEAGTLRVLARSVEADQPMLREYLEDVNLPQSLNRRLSSLSMRAVNVSLPLERAGGGLIQKGEHVDVYLTTRVSVAGKNHNSAITQTAPIARNLTVIVKRNMLWNALAPNDPKKPIDYTLEANPYRAALIEFCKNKGDLSLVTTAAPQESISQSTRAVVPPSQSDSTSKEYQDEDKRIAEFLSGERTISDADLERIFNLRPIVIHRPVQVETYTGVHFTGVQTFGRNGNGLMRPVTSEPSMGYAFAPLNNGKGSESNGNGNP
jgi:Flp pilus assembly protein CpaB